jgi:hypothetical protein
LRSRTPPIRLSVARVDGRRGNMRVTNPRSIDTRTGQPPISLPHGSILSWSGFGHISTYGSLPYRPEKRAKAVSMKRVRRFDARKSLSSARARTDFFYKAQSEDPYPATRYGLDIRGQRIGEPTGVLVRERATQSRKSAQMT